MDHPWPYLLMGLLAIIVGKLIARATYKPSQRTFCWCPNCHADLCSSESFVSDTDLVRYRCARCGHESGWDFDAPTPILIEGRRP